MLSHLILLAKDRVCVLGGVSKFFKRLLQTSSFDNCIDFIEVKDIDDLIDRTIVEKVDDKRISTNRSLLKLKFLVVAWKPRRYNIE